MAIALLIPLTGLSDYNLSRIETMTFFWMGAMSLNFAFGYGGKLAIGQPLLITLAAYVSGIVSIHWGLSFWEALPIAVLSSVIASLILGIPGLRVQGWYLAVIAFLAVSVVPNLVLAFGSITGGSDGLIGDIRPITFGGGQSPSWVVYEVIILAAVLTWIGIRNLVKSGWGRALQVSRDHPVACTAIGISNIRLGILVYVLSAIPCGIAGSLFVHSQQFISSANFDSTTILLFLGSVFLGGAGTLWGPLLGVAIFQGITLYIGEFSPYNALILGIGVLVAALLFRGGLIRNVRLAYQRIRPSASTTVRLEEMEDVAMPAVQHPTHIAVSGVQKRFGGNVVLRGVDIEVHAGEVVAVVGPNGSGKTTLLNVISGFVHPDSGSVAVNGQDVTHQAGHTRAKLGVARTFQVPKLVSGMTVVENVECGAVGTDKPSMIQALLRLPGFHRAEASRRHRAAEACQAVGFGTALSEVEVATLPLGLKRIVEVGRAISANSTVVCMDEPVAGLHGNERALVASVARSLAQSGRSVLIVEHNLPFVLDVCDRLVLLIDGVVADVGRPEDVGDPSRPLGEYFRTYVSR